MEQLVGRQWSVWRLTPLLDVDGVPPEVLCAELEAALGLSRRGDGRAAVGFVDRSAPEPRLLTIAAELSHAKTRGCVPPGVLPARTPESGGENDDDDALTERFEAVAVLSPPLPRRRQCCCCALLTAGAERLGAKAVAWIERRFDCYARRLPALPPVQLSRVALRWAVAAAASAADAGSLALSFAAPEGVRGVADVAVELPLSALHAQLLQQQQQQQPTEQGVSEALAPVCRRLCGVDTSKLPLVAFSTPDAALTAAAELALFSHAFPLALVLDLARDF